MNIKTLFPIISLIFNHTAAVELDPSSLPEPKAKVNQENPQVSGSQSPSLKSRPNEKKKTEKEIPWIGLYGGPINKALAAQLSIDYGCIVLYSFPNDPLAIAGIKKYDIITEFDGKSVKKMADFREILKTKSIGDEVKLKLIRGGKPLSKTTILGQRPKKIANFKVPGDQQKSLLIEREIKLSGAQEPTLTPTQRKELMSQLGLSPDSNYLKELLGNSKGKSGYNFKKKIKHAYSKGTLVIELNQGKKKLIAKDLGGVVEFEGMIDTEEEKKKVPADLLKKSEMLLKTYENLLK